MSAAAAAAAPHTPTLVHTAATSAAQEGVLSVLCAQTDRGSTECSCRRHLLCVSSPMVILLLLNSTLPNVAVVAPAAAAPSTPHCCCCSYCSSRSPCITQHLLLLLLTAAAVTASFASCGVRSRGPLPLLCCLLLLLPPQPPVWCLWGRPCAAASMQQSRGIAPQSFWRWGRVCSTHAQRPVGAGGGGVGRAGVSED